MISNPVETAGLVVREVRTSQRDDRFTRVVVARRTYPTDPSDLWDALTNAERIPRWFSKVDGDLREGGRFQVEGNAGGVVERCEEPESFSITWDYGDLHSWVTVLLTPTDDGTALELVHEAPVDPDMWKQFGPGAVGVGWDLALLGLGLHVDTGEPVDPEMATTFTLTPEGAEFVRACADAWAEAAVADGDEQEVASEAADGTVAFYTTPPDSGAGA